MTAVILEQAAQLTEHADLELPAGITVRATDDGAVVLIAYTLEQADEVLGDWLDEYNETHDSALVERTEALEQAIALGHAWQSRP